MVQHTHPHPERKKLASMLEAIGESKKAAQLMDCRRADEDCHYPCGLRYLCPQCQHRTAYQAGLIARACVMHTAEIDKHGSWTWLTLCAPPGPDPELQAQILRETIRRVKRWKGSWSCVAGLLRMLDACSGHAPDTCMMHLHIIAYSSSDKLNEHYAESRSAKRKWHHIHLMNTLRRALCKVAGGYGVELNPDAHATAKFVDGSVLHAQRVYCGDPCSPAVDPGDYDPGELGDDAARCGMYPWEPKRKKTKQRLDTVQKTELQLADLGHHITRTGAFRGEKCNELVEAHKIAEWIIWQVIQDGLVTRSA